MKREEGVIKYRLITVMMGLVLCLGVTLFTAGCNRGGIGNRLEVTIELPDPHSLDFDTYKTILYKDLEHEGLPKGFNPDELLKGFFVDHLTRITGKKIEHWDRDKHGELVPDGLLIISGKMKLVIKSRSKIKEIKEKGKRAKKKFVTVQHWTLKLEIFIKDASTEKIIYKDTFNGRLANADADSVKFNFENLFFKVTNRFEKRITRTKKMQRRYLLR